VSLTIRCEKAGLYRSAVRLRIFGRKRNESVAKTGKIENYTCKYRDDAGSMFAETF